MLKQNNHAEMYCFRIISLQDIHDYSVILHFNRSILRNIQVIQCEVVTIEKTFRIMGNPNRYLIFSFRIFIAF